MKGVCLIGPGTPGGIDRYVSIVSQGLAERCPGRLVRVIDSRGRRAWSSPLRCAIAGLQVLALALGGRVSAMHLMASERTSLWRKGALACLGRVAGLQVVLHHHGAELPERARRGTRAERLALRLVSRVADRHLVLGEAWRSALVAAGARPGSVEILPNALPERPPPLRDPVGARAPRLLFLGEISRRKGIFTVLDALVLLRRRGIAFEACIAGDGPERAALADRVATLRRSGATLHAPGRVDRDEAERLMERADVLLHPSTHEGLPMALIEALRAGLPAIASPVGAIAEAMPHGEGLVHVAPDDPEALAAAIAELAEDADRRRRLGRAGRSAFERRFTLQPHLDRLIAIYGWPAAPTAVPTAAPAAATPRRAAA